MRPPVSLLWHDKGLSFFKKLRPHVTPKKKPHVEPWGVTWGLSFVVLKKGQGASVFLKKSGPCHALGRNKGPEDFLKKEAQCCTFRILPCVSQHFCLSFYMCEPTLLPFFLCDFASKYEDEKRVYFDCTIKMVSECETLICIIGCS